MAMAMAPSRRQEVFSVQNQRRRGERDSVTRYGK